METDIIQMRQGEIERLRVVHRVIGREIRQAKAAEIVGISVRQMQRMIKKVREEGERHSPLAGAEGALWGDGTDGWFAP